MCSALGVEFHLEPGSLSSLGGCLSLSSSFAAFNLLFPGPPSPELEFLPSSNILDTAVYLGSVICGPF